jgi:hypothetical protein
MMALRIIIGKSHILWCYDVRKMRCKLKVIYHILLWESCRLIITARRIIENRKSLSSAGELHSHDLQEPYVTVKERQNIGIKGWGLLHFSEKIRGKILRL